MPFFSFSSDPARSDQCFAMSLTIIHSVPKSASQAKLKFACICQSCSMYLSWLLNVFLEMLHECQTKPSWSSTTTKLLLLNWNDFASCVGLVWTSVLCAAIHNHSQKLSVLVKILVRLSNDGTEFEQSLHLIDFSTPGYVVPMAMFAQAIWWWSDQHLKLWEGKSNSAVWTISGMKLHLWLLNYELLSIYEISNE